MARTKLDPAHVQMQLKVTLLGIRPLIWRRLLVPADIKHPKLHSVLQPAFGWTTSHLHAFRLEGKPYEANPPQGWADEIFGAGSERQDEKKFRLYDLLHAPEERLVYEYDFGDSWEHEVLLEKLIPRTPAKHAACLTGKRAGPPEDCGGIPGYYNLLDAIANPKHPEHQELLDWLGEPYAPEAFNAEALNRLLRQLKL